LLEVLILQIFVMSLTYQLQCETFMFMDALQQCLGGLVWPRLHTGTKTRRGQRFAVGSGPHVWPARGIVGHSGSSSSVKPISSLVEAADLTLALIGLISQKWPWTVRSAQDTKTLRLLKKFSAFRTRLSQRRCIRDPSPRALPSLRNSWTLYTS